MGKLRQWKMPEYYSGTQWNGYLVAPVGRHRDSDTVERSNWNAQLERIPADGESVVIVRENHWAVGWVEWLAILPTATEAVAEAEKIADELEGYPLLDEDSWSELEFEKEEASQLLREARENGEVE